MSQFLLLRLERGVCSGGGGDSLGRQEPKVSTGWLDTLTLKRNLLPICSSKKAGATAKGKVGGRWK